MIELLIHLLLQKTSKKFEYYGTGSPSKKFHQPKKNSVEEEIRQDKKRKSEKKTRILNKESRRIQSLWQKKEDVVREKTATSHTHHLTILKDHCKSTAKNSTPIDKSN
jgi:hypothetical protein